MSKNELILKSFNVESFGGINKSEPIVLNLTEYYQQGKNIAIATGDQAVNKTSWLNSLLYLFASSFNFGQENFVNKVDNALKVQDEFEYNGKQYKVNATKSKFELLRKFSDGEDERWIPESEPKTLLKKIIGGVGVSPMFLKEKKGAEQIKWIRSFFSIDAEIEDAEKKIAANLKVVTESRTAANREYDRIKKTLESNDLYVNWEESEKTYSVSKTSESEKQRVTDLRKANQLYEGAIIRKSSIENSVVSLGKEIDDIDLQIQSLQKKKEDKALELEMAKQRLVAADKWIEESKGVTQELEQAESDYMQIEKYLANQSQWQSIKQQKSEMDEFETLVQNADAKKDELRGELLELAKQGLPEIEGLEVVTNMSIGDSRDEGIYWHGKTLAQLSESECWNLFLKIWGERNVQFVFIENIGSLGSKSVEILNELAAKGVKIFASEMKRDQKDIRIVFTDKI